MWYAIAMAERRKHEPTQPGNPRQITVAQHVHSRWCIDRFADAEGRVAVLRHGTTLPFLTSATNNVFCVNRAWDEHLEHGLFNQVECAFYEVVQTALARGVVDDHQAVSAYLSVWQIRADFLEHPIEDLELAGHEDSSLGLTKDEEEIVEKKHAAFTRGNTVPGRFVAWLEARRNHDMTMSHLAGTVWGVIRAEHSAGFICPDRPARRRYIPIAPTMALIAAYGRLDLSREQVLDLNRSSRAQSYRITFGHPNDVSALASDAMATEPSTASLKPHARSAPERADGEK